MTIENIEQICSNSAKAQTAITMSVSRAESKELKEAVELINKYKNQH